LATYPEDEFELGVSATTKLGDNPYSKIFNGQIPDFKIFVSRFCPAFHPPLILIDTMDKNVFFGVGNCFYRFFCVLCCFLAHPCVLLPSRAFLCLFEWCFFGRSEGRGSIASCSDLLCASSAAIGLRNPLASDA
jgi:hypothetical protein